MFKYPVQRSIWISSIMHLCLAQAVLTILWLDKLNYGLWSTWRTFWVLYLIKSNSPQKKTSTEIVLSRDLTLFC